ncbi:hypothetical protein ACOMHN_014085 [Nucella lapillus]
MAKQSPGHPGALGPGRPQDESVNRTDVHQPLPQPLMLFIDGRRPSASPQPLVPFVVLMNGHPTRTHKGRDKERPWGQSAWEGGADDTGNDIDR